MKYLVFLIPFLFVSCKDGKTTKVQPKDLDSLLVMYPDSVEIIVMHGNKMLKEFKFDKAMADGAKAFRLDSAKIDVRMLYADVLNNRPNRTADEIAAAQNQYRFIIKKETKNTKALVGLASTYSQQMDFDNSFKYINMALKIDPRYRDAYVMKGSNYLVLSKIYPEADGRPSVKFMDLTKSSYETAVQQDPKFYRAYLMLGALYQAEGNEICIQYYKTAAQLQPKNMEVLFSLAYAQQLFEAPEEAIEIYRKMIKIDTSYYQALNQIGVIKQHNYGDIDSAIYYYNSALQTEPRFVEAWHNLGSCYEEKGDLTRALQSYAKALKYDPDFKMSRDRADALKGAR
jgi:tetratricopeptide (TPR) repeat protein